MLMDMSARMGTRALAVAVLLHRLVITTVSPVKMMLASHPGKLVRFNLEII